MKMYSRSSVSKTYRGISPTDKDGRNGLRNPERGLRFEIRVGELPGKNIDEFACSKWPFPEYKQDGVTITQAYCYLTGYCEAGIADDKLAALQKSFDRARNCGVKFLLRFAYESNRSSPGPTSDRVLSHIDQLREIIHKNIDVIYVMQCGFVGLWGEWHTSVHGLESDSGKSSAILRSALEMLPSGRFTQMRRAKYKKNNLEALKAFEEISSSTAFGDKPAARIGFFNDGTLANSCDGGTWPDAPFSTHGNPEFDYVCREAPYMPVDGELFWTGHGERFIAGLTAAERFCLHHYTTFSYVHGFHKLDKDNVEWVIDDWQKQELPEKVLKDRRLPVSDSYFDAAPRTSFEYIRDHLGYRIEVQSAEWPRTAWPDDEIKFSLSLINRGFSTFINVRRPFFTLIGTSGQIIEIPTEADCRSWQPYKPGDPERKPPTHKVSASIKLPQGISPGEWQVGFWLPDAAPSLRLEPEYAVRCANGDIPWLEIAGYGCNVLGNICVGS